MEGTNKVQSNLLEREAFNVHKTSLFISLSIELEARIELSVIFNGAFVCEQGVLMIFGKKINLAQRKS